MRDRDAWRQAHRSDWIVGSAFGDWADWAPPTKADACATLGGGDGRARWFLIEAAEYRLARSFGFAIDLGRHPEISDPHL